jgi:hypothetical protein
MALFFLYKEWSGKNNIAIIGHILIESVVEGAGF